MTHRLANAIRILALDAVEAAQSGHPGMPMGMADVAQILWCDVLKHCPNDPNWADRDRFVLSNGHGSMLLYAALYLRGYALTLEDLKAFRQLGSHTPGHPEYSIQHGIETTTGPLGQGLANGVGLALAERLLADRFNRPDFELVNHLTYVMVGDGCLMEGISHEAASLAGAWGLGRLIVIWDDNGISIDGPIKGWCRDQTPERFEAYGWHVVRDVDGHDLNHIQQAFKAAQHHETQPTLICCKTVIGQGSPTLSGQAVTHGAPLGAEEAVRVRAHLNWPSAEPFEVPEDILEAWRQADPGAAAYDAWQQMWLSYRLAHPDLAKEFERVMAGDLPEDFADNSQAIIDLMANQTAAKATRKHSGAVIQQLAKILPEWVGGSADLTESNCTALPDAQAVGLHTAGQYIHFGVREFGMFAVMNGLALHGGVRPFGGTFLTFSDYGRNAIRLASMMSLPVCFVLTHDSVALGEDGPTHQPIEHIASLRAMPQLDVWRPCDGIETAIAWTQIIGLKQPSALLLTRQALPTLPGADLRVRHALRGGYIFYEPEGEVDAIVMATGSEVALAYEAAQTLGTQGIGVRVVSMPCVEQFLRQDSVWQTTVLPQDIEARVAVEAGVAQCWHQFVGRQGRVVSIETYGHSAPGDAALSACHMTVDAVIQAIQSLVLIEHVNLIGD
jgi:transketolase